MKSFSQILTIALLPMLSGSLSRAQDDPVSQPAPEVKPATEASTVGQFENDRQEFERAGELYRAQVAAAPAAGNYPVFSQRLQNVVARAPGGGGKPLVIRCSDMDPKDQANLEEDLAVMSHLFNKALQELPVKVQPYTAMGINVLSGSGPGEMRSIYLDGYGVLFMLNVGFPLLPPAAKAESKKEEPEADSAWEEAKQELYGQRPGFGLAPGPAEDYSEEKVEKLKTTLLESLKSAANIRELRADEVLTVCVLGGANGGPGRFGYKATAKRPAANWEPKPEFYTMGRPDGARGTVMAIRVKKSDVDAFAKGKMDLEQFRKHARIETYFGGSAGGSIWGGGGGAAFGRGGGGAFGGNGF